MELLDYLAIIKRKFLIFVVTFVILFATTSLIWNFGTKNYEALMTFAVQRIGSAITDQYGGYYAIQADDLFATNFISWSNSPLTITTIFQKADINIENQDPTAVAKKFVFKQNSAQDISLKIKDSDKSKLEKLTAAIKQVTDEKSQIDLTTAQAQGGRTVQLMSGSTITAKKTSAVIIFGASAFISLILAVILVLLLNYFSKTIDTENQIKQILGKNSDILRIKSLKATTSDAEEKIRTLRNLLFAANKTPFATLLTDLNNLFFAKFASRLAESTATTQKVILIDAYLDEPKLNKIYQIKQKGLAEIIDKDKFLVGLHKVHNNLSVIPAGKVTDKVKDQTTSQAVGKLIAQAKKSADFILFLAPSVLTHAQTYAILDQVQSVILIIKLSQTTKEALQDFKELIKNKKLDLRVLVVG